MLNREALSETFDKQDFPIFLCPTCSVGTLTCDKNSIIEVEPEYSKLGPQDDSWEPDWTTKRFSAHFVCNRPKCGEISLMIGDVPMVEYDDPEFGWAFQEVFSPKAMFPTPFLFPMPNDTPRNIKRIFLESFSTYWQDKNASMNKVRIAIEMILDDQGIVRQKKTKNGKVTDMRLHERIQTFENKIPEPAKSLMAAKMVGNIGSHNDQEIARDIVLDVYELLISCISALYGGPDSDLKKRRDMLIQSRGEKNK